MTKTTPFHPAHQRLQARMVDFHGWEMPLHYGSQVEEHHAVRQDCGMFDISHMCALDAIGPDAKPFMQRLLANDVEKLRAGKALYSCMLNEAGGVIDDLIAYYLGGGRYRIVVNAATSEKDIRWMRACIESWRMQLTLTPRCDLAMLAVQGPHARETVWQALPGIREATTAMPPFHAQQLEDFFVARTGYTGEDGFELTFPGTLADALWNRLLELGVKPCGLGARDTLRLEAGMNLYGQDMDEDTSPLDTGLAWTVVFDTARNFVGREALLTRSRQSQFLGLVLQGGGVLRPQQRVFTTTGEGIITSGSFSPTMQQSIALARLPLDSTVGDEVEVEIRDKRHAARIVKPPFVRNGKILV
jgi:aminomethyltransferase